ITIHKLSLHNGGPNSVETHKDAEFLHVAVQRNVICVWVKVDTSKPKTLRSFGVVGTGFELDSTYSKYIGTVFYNNGQFVWHVFDLGEDKEELSDCMDTP